MAAAADMDRVHKAAARRCGLESSRESEFKLVLKWGKRGEEVAV